MTTTDLALTHFARLEAVLAAQEMRALEERIAALEAIARTIAEADGEVA